MSKVELVIFDLGGVLIRRDPGKVTAQMAKACGCDPKKIDQVINDPALVEAFELGRVTAPELFAQVKQRLTLNGMTFEQFVVAWNAILDEDQKTTWVIDRLRHRYKLAVLSNTNILHDEHIRATWPVFSWIHHWIASYKVGLRKPEPAIYELVLKTANVPAYAAVYVDDIKEFTDAGARMGLKTIHFSDGQSIEQELRAFGVHV